MPRKVLTVTEPYLPSLDEFLPYLKEIWTSKQLTNNGPFHQRLELALAHFLGVEHLALCANGTLALITALQALRVSGEVITTPYSFVATAHSLIWNNIKPVFVDIDPITLNLDPDKIEEAITPSTSAIMPVHCYGRPCDVHRVKAIADAYGLRVIYDAAHAFAVRLNGAPLLLHGDLSILSFHATKVFNTFEGGAIVCSDAKTKQRIDYLKNFGIADEVTVVGPGINGKMNEFQAALGLLQLGHVSHAIEARKAVDSRYRQGLIGVEGLVVVPEPTNTDWNYSYFPVLVGDNYPVSRDELYSSFREAGIHARRYFYPLVSNLPMYRALPSSSKSNLPTATEVSSRVLCLPIHPNLSVGDQLRVIRHIRRES